MSQSVVTQVSTIDTPSAENVLIKVQGVREDGASPLAPSTRAPSEGGGHFLDFSFSCYSVHQKYKCLKRYVAQYDILWHRVTLRNEFSALEYLIL